MKKIIVSLLLLISIGATAQTFTLKSNTLGGQATMKEAFDGWGCKGKNISPELKWENAPTGTKSFAVTIHDEDAPTGGSGWWHWLVFNLPPSITQLEEGFGNKTYAHANEVQSITDFSSYGYSGPCPPIGDKAHKYTITVYALNAELLELKKDANPGLVGFTLEQNCIEKASMVFYFKR